MMVRDNHNDDPSSDYAWPIDYRTEHFPDPPTCATKKGDGKIAHKQEDVDG